MSENLITIRQQLDEVKGRLEELGKVIERLSESAKGVGKGVQQEFVSASDGIKKLRIASLETTKNLKQQKDAFNDFAKSLRASKISFNQYETTLGQLIAKINALKNVTEKEKASLRGVADGFIKARNEVKRLTDEKRRNEQQTISLRQRVIALDGDMKRMKHSTTGAIGGFRGLGTAFRQVAGVFGYGLGLYGLVRGMREVLGVIAKYETAQKQLESVTGATTAEMRNMSDMARELGASTIFGAKGITEMQVQLAKMGFTLGEIKNMSKGIAMLATATQEDLGKAAETVANVLRAFNMDATETQRVVDTMGKSFTASALDMERFRQSIKYIAPIASQANFTIEETTSLLAKLADAGIYGSLAGTSLRNVIAQLSDSSSALTKRVGMTVNGFDDFTKALWVLNEQGTDLEDVFNIMDRRAASAFTIIMKGVGTLEEFRNALMKSEGEVERMANIQMQSLINKTKLARNAFQSFILALDDGNNTMTNMFKTALDAFTGFTNIITRNMLRQSRATQDELSNINVYLNSLNRVGLTFEQRLRYFKELKAEYPDYFKNIGDDIKTSEELAEAIGLINKKAIELVRTLSGKVKFEIIYEEIDAIQDRIDKLIKREYNARKRMEKQLIKLRLEGHTEFKTDFEEYTKGFLAVTDKFYQLGAQARKARVAREEITMLENFALKEQKRHLDELKKRQDILTVSYIAFLKEIRDGYQPWIDEINKAKKELREIYNEIEKDPTVDKSEAAETAVKTVTDALKDQINVARERQAEISKGGFVDNKEYKELEENIEGWMQAVEAANKEATDLRNKITDTDKENEDQIRRWLQLEELRLRRAYEGLELEKRLIEARKKAADRRAAIAAESEQADLYEIARLERIIALQELKAKQLEEEHKLNEISLRYARDLQKIYDDIVGEDFKAIEFDVGYDEVNKKIELMVDRQKQIYKEMVSETNEFERQRTAAVEVEYAKRIANTIEGTEQRKELEAQMQKELDAISMQAKNRRELDEIRHQNAMRIIQFKGVEERIALAKREADRTLDTFKLRQERERIRFDAVRRTARETEAFEEKQREEALRAQIAYLSAQKKAIGQELMALKSKGDEESALFKQKYQEYKQLTEEQKVLLEELMNPRFKKEQWEEVVDIIRSSLSRIGDAFQKLANDKEAFFRREREMMDRLVDESSRSLDQELKLREQGFASDVEAARAYHEKMKALRRSAIKEEERAAEAARRTEAIVQSLNLMSSATQIMKKSYGKYDPLVATVVALGTIAGMFALWSNVKQRSRASTRFTKGGTFILDGKSHAQGGVALTPRHEAEGGEAVTVWNRSVTRKHYPQIKELSAAINKGELSQQSSVNVFADNEDLSAIRRLLENEERVYYEGNKRIVKKGNYTYICHLN